MNFTRTLFERSAQNSEVGFGFWYLQCIRKWGYDRSRATKEPVTEELQERTALKRLSDTFKESKAH